MTDLKQRILFRIWSSCRGRRCCCRRGACHVRAAKLEDVVASIGERGFGEVPKLHEVLARTVIDAVHVKEPTEGACAHRVERCCATSLRECARVHMNGSRWERR